MSDNRKPDVGTMTAEQRCDALLKALERVLDEARRALSTLSPNPPEAPVAPAVFVVRCCGVERRVPAGALPKEPGPLDAAMFYHNRTPRTALAHDGSVSDPAGAVFAFTRGPGHAFVWHGRVGP